MEPSTTTGPTQHENSQGEIKIGVELKSQMETPTTNPTQGKSQTPPSPGNEIKSDELMGELSEYILVLATIVATVTYAVGFSPPGGVWQKTDAATGQLAGDSILRVTSYRRYLVFFYCNAAAFASSLVVIVLAFLHEEKKHSIRVYALRLVMLLDLLSISGAYAAGTCRDTATTIYSLILVAIVFIYLAVQKGLAWQVQGQASGAQVRSQGRIDDQANSTLVQVQPRALPCASSATAPTTNPTQGKSQTPPLPGNEIKSDELMGELSEYVAGIKIKEHSEKRVRKFLMLLATFAVSVTYVAGMSTPGGFWDNTAGDHRAGNAILKHRHGARLTVFLCFNTTAFAASLLIIVVLLERKYRARNAYFCIIVAMISLFGAYATGSSRKIKTTVYVGCLVVAVLVFITILRFFIEYIEEPCFWRKIKEFHHSVSTTLKNATEGPQITDGRKAAEKARSPVLLLATLAATITYQAGLDPPGGVWPDKGDGHMAGDPILSTMNPRRYKAFFYCNSIAFVASLVAIILVQKKLLLKNHVLEAVMILDLFGLIGAYAAGSCRDLSTSIYAMALAGAVLVYVVIHVVFYFTLDHGDISGKIEDDGLVEKRRKQLLLFAVLAATITYQAGLTPPGGFHLENDDSNGFHAGDPVLLHNFPRRYTVFFYCNSVSFMLSMALIILLVNPHLYRPAIRSYALAVCTAAGLFGLIGAYAAGSTQHMRTSTYIFVLVVVVLLVITVLLLVFWVKESPSTQQEVSSNSKKDQGEKKNPGKRRKYLMLIGILVASVTYQAGLEPPGGAWQQSSGWYDAGNPVMHDNRRHRYLAFFYSNSTSFVASIVVIILLLSERLHKNSCSLWLVMNTTIVLDLLALLGAYAVGSSREWKTCVYVIALIIVVLVYIGIHLILAMAFLRSHRASISHHRNQGGQATA